MAEFLSRRRSSAEIYTHISAVLCCLSRSCANTLFLQSCYCKSCAISDDGVMNAQVRLAGPFLDNGGQMQGSFLIVEGSRADVDTFVAADPYGTAGLFRSTSISEWIWAVSKRSAACAVSERPATATTEGGRADPASAGAPGRR
jgi:hypothetical protein